MSAELTVVVPTYNENDNIQPLIDQLASALQGIEWEVIFADDDSSDGTPDTVARIARQNPRVRLVHRIGRRGLSSACIEGMLASTAPYLAVMDADGQHDETILPVMLDRLKQEDLDIVVGSRYTEGASTGELGSWRTRISRVATHASRLVLREQLQDPMSGYFVLKREFLNESMRSLYGRGFKILLDLFASSPRPVRFTEIPYTMRGRRHGESKLDSMVIIEYGLLLINKFLGRIIPPRFVMFCLVGLSGVFVHMAILATLYKWLLITYMPAQVTATIVAMTTNYLLNNTFTFRDRRLKGLDLLRGLMSFYIVCSLGALVNVALATYLYMNNVPWWLAALFGITAAAVWNFTLSSIYTWRRRIE